jgi:hypothetical protein
MADTHNIPPKVIEAVQRGNLIEAIKYMRQHKPQLGLAEARALIEAIQRQGGVPAVVQKAQAKVAAQANEHTPKIHAHHAVPPLPQSMMDPNHSPGEVPRASSGAAFALVIVAIVIVLAAAAYFGR